jgi:hypothetical protein
VGSGHGETLARSITDPDRQTDALARLAEALAKAGQLKRAADAATLSMPAIALTGSVEVTRRARTSALPKRGALAKLRYSPYLAECSGCPGMFAVRTGGGGLRGLRVVKR